MKSRGTCGLDWDQRDQRERGDSNTQGSTRDMPRGVCMSGDDPIHLEKAHVCPSSVY